MKHLLLLFVLTFVCCTPPQFPTKIDGVLVEYAPCSDEQDRKFWLHFPHEVSDEIYFEKNRVNDGIVYIGNLNRYSISVEVAKAFDPIKVVKDLIEFERKLHKE